MHARPNTTILLKEGTYRLRRMIDINTSDVVLRGERGDPDRVMLLGAGMNERQVGVALSLSASRITLADITVGNVGFHGIQVRGEKRADHCMFHNVRVINTGQQLLKGSMGSDGRGPHRGTVACSRFAYSSHAPSDYTNGVDVLGGRGWTVRQTIFQRIRGPEGRPQAGPAILFWRGSAETLIEGNLVLDCYRGIALGLTNQPEGGQGNQAAFSDHLCGAIRRNVVWNLNRWADEPIEANACPGVRIEHNTVLVEGKMPWSISVRFPSTDADVLNNLTNRRIMARDGARLAEQGNITDARHEWFVDPSRGNLQLSRDELPPVDAAVDPAEETAPFLGGAPDVGAYEYRSPQ
ncbi:right-handed parallel beta-helix repeat-containing protein [Tautonia rosea]|uniref:hypothetical protein n=1 Tax=Tautonia rosea TaxID=2728037 RepID=UPI001473A7EF|nr:hypothetical protein [Tautonia rosea]